MREADGLYIWGKRVLDRRNSKYKGSEGRTCLQKSKNRKVNASGAE